MSRTLVPLLLVVGLALGWGAARLATPPSPDPTAVGLSAAGALAGGDTAGYARALEPRPFVFPDDHGAHPAYRTEWWYLTGHLDAVPEEEGGVASWGDEARAGTGAPSGSTGTRSFGFQLTFFRSALSPEAPDRPGNWSTNQLWMAHFALTDVERGAHIHEERFARGAAGLAGAEADPFRVWLDDWALERVADAPAVEGSGSAFPFHLRASVPGRGGLELRVEEGKLPVLQGDAGLSQKGPDPGNASYYLSWTRMPLEGWVEVEGARLRVRGEGWMDREWSTSALGEMHLGWDWFSLQLDDGRELMFFELRRDDGLPDPLNHGALVEADGSWRHLSGEEVTLAVTDHWASPVDGTRYPSGWTLRIPGEALELTLTPRVRDQEMNVTFRYWEGALLVEGTHRGQPIRGRGYAELTGYAEEGGRGGG
jgi:predicted secreted hydrolase